MDKNIEERIDEGIEAVEGYRRSLLKFDTGPLAGTQVPDYATALNGLKLGLAAIGEALPNQQLERTEVAFKLMQRSMAALHLYLLAKGADV